MKNTIVQKIEIPKSKEEAATVILKQLENLFEVAEPEDLIRIQQSLLPKVVSPEERELAKKIAGKDYVEPSSSRLLELQLGNLERYYQRRRELLVGSITSSKVAELLGCENRSTVRDRRLAKRILGIKDKGVYKYPLWQFDPEGDDGVIDGLTEVLAALDVSDFTKLNWLLKPHLAMNGRTPVEMLKQGEIEAVVVEARAVGVGW
ncbi:hypothetical protein C7B62_24685 [Pleurocapsa sp. CCALA 161]|uniref:hypothetical protein n=1 Tax=Pleurocapsa sp. CCALA 161 TaxID=2107688 RepID=UPI000D066F1E|nr:hypothetical protein [Pleurocapsa sp. CCALA 161]PSB05677.1 hypothetical protein C7B62_24685 [Pleurocapsa sp. CCALA 161]